MITVREQWIEPGRLRWQAEGLDAPPGPGFWGSLAACARLVLGIEPAGQAPRELRVVFGRLVGGWRIHTRAGVSMLGRAEDDRYLVAPLPRSWWHRRGIPGRSTYFVCPQTGRALAWRGFKEVAAQRVTVTAEPVGAELVCAGRAEDLPAFAREVLASGSPFRKM